jgi:hypothetical protein
MSANVAKKERFQLYEVTAQIYAGADKSTVWEGTLPNVAAPNRRVAEAEARQIIEHTIPEHDARIQPGIRILSVGKVEPVPQLIAEQLVEKAERHAQDASEADHAMGDLQDALRACFEAMTPGQAAEVLYRLREEEKR